MKYKFSVDFPIERNDQEIVLKVKGTYYSDPGNYSGPPEDCYPADEDFDFNIENWSEDLEEEEYKELEERIRLQVEDQIEAAFDDFIEDYDPDQEDEDYDDYDDWSDPDWDDGYDDSYEDE